MRVELIKILKNPRNFGVIAALKLAEGILILLAAKILVMLINSPAPKLFGGIFFIWTLRLAVENICAKKFL